MPAYDETKLKQAQEASLKILLEVDRICRANGLSYFMDAGTLIGAARHQGFIPWDDDIDIAMTRENFEKFAALLRPDRFPETNRKKSKKNTGIETTNCAAGKTKPNRENDSAAAKKETEKSAALPETMELILPDEYRGGRAFYDFTPRIIYQPSRRHAKSAETAYYGGKLNHLWVDIFILDNLPDGRFPAFAVRFLQKCIYGFSMPRRYGLDFAKYSPKDRARVHVLAFLGRLFRMPELFRMQEALSKRFDGKKTKRLYYSNYQPDYLYVTLKRESCAGAIELPFEGHMLMAPVGFEDVLHEIYGDYRKLPPESQRVPSHSDELEVLA